MDCGHEHTTVDRDRYWSGNITHNLGLMARMASIYDEVWRPEDCGITTAEQMIPILEHGIVCVESSPDILKPLNPENGWGSYDGLLRFLRRYLEACREHPDATVRASR
jgi:hypothetical protein